MNVLKWLAVAILSYELFDYLCNGDAINKRIEVYMGNTMS